jgi:hypothetical protein
LGRENKIRLEEEQHRTDKARQDKTTQDEDQARRGKTIIGTTIQSTYGKKNLVYLSCVKEGVALDCSVWCCVVVWCVFVVVWLLCDVDVVRCVVLQRDV